MSTEDTLSSIITRVQRKKISILDYIQIKEAQISCIETRAHFGTFDHLVVKCRLDGALGVKRRKRTICSKSKASLLVSRLFDREDSLQLKAPLCDFLEDWV